MSKVIVLAVLAAGVAAVVRKRQSSKADADLWREATSASR